MRVIDFVDGFESSTEPTGVVEFDAEMAELDTRLDNAEAHASNTSNPHSVTKTQVGLGNVTNDAQLKVASNLSDLGSASTARTNLELGTAATQNVSSAAFNADKIQSVSVSASAPSTNDVLKYNGSVWAPASPGATSLSVVSKSADYTITTSDDVIIVTTTGTNQTLPAASGNSGKLIRIINSISGFSTTTIKKSDTSTLTTLNTNGEEITLISDGTNWQITRYIPTTSGSYVPTLETTTGVVTRSAWWIRIGDHIMIHFFVDYNASGGATNWGIYMPSGLTIDNAKLTYTADKTEVGSATWDDAGVCKKGSFVISTTSIFRFKANSASAVLLNSDYANTDVISGTVVVPVSGWKG